MGVGETVTTIASIGAWIAENRKWLGEVYQWLFNRTGEEMEFVIFGAGGVGKSTTAKVLAGHFDSALQIPGMYEESIGVESLALRDDPSVSLIVPPGQRHRRDATWAEFEAGISQGAYGGIIIVNANGYHSLGDISYKELPMYGGDKARFLQSYLDDRRAEEVKVLSRLAPFISRTPRKLWILNLITKQDLWWPSREVVKSHYNDGAYSSVLRTAIAPLGRRCRTEFVFGSLVTDNFKTGRNEELSKVAAGYPQQAQVDSIKNLWTTLGALKQWEQQ